MASPVAALRGAARTLCELAHPTLRRPAALVGVGFLCTTAGYYAVALASDIGVGLDVYSRQCIRRSTWPAW